VVSFQRRFMIHKYDALTLVPTTTHNARPRTIKRTKGLDAFACQRRDTESRDGSSRGRRRTAPTHSDALRSRRGTNDDERRSRRSWTKTPAQSMARSPSRRGEGRSRERGRGGATSVDAPRDRDGGGVVDGIDDPASDGDEEDGGFRLSKAPPLTPDMIDELNAIETRRVLARWSARMRSVKRRVEDCARQFPTSSLVLVFTKPFRSADNQRKWCVEERTDGDLDATSTRRPSR
jgi:hypothetical protein